jgi:hypothetical protein
MKFKFLANNLKNKRFDYAPMHFDERKERLELKKKQFERLDNPDLHEDDRRKILRQNLQDSWSRTSYVKNQRSASNFRILLLIIVFLVLGYFVFNGIGDVETVVKKL